MKNDLKTVGHWILTPAEQVRPGQWISARGEHARVRQAGPAMHPRHGRIIRIETEAGAVLHFAPYATVDVMG